MTLCEAEAELPNGFHDARLLGMAIDYERQTLWLRLHVDISSTDESEPRYSEVQVVISGLQFVVVEPPEPQWKCKGSLWVSGCSTDEISTLSQRMQAVRTQIPEGTFAYSFFIHESNSFIHIAGSKATVNRNPKAVEFS